MHVRVCEGLAILVGKPADHGCHGEPASSEQGQGQREYGGLFEVGGAPVVGGQHAQREEEGRHNLHDAQGWKKKGKGAAEELRAGQRLQLLYL
jgi:hypothetical protein